MLLQALNMPFDSISVSLYVLEFFYIKVVAMLICASVVIFVVNYGF